MRRLTSFRALCAVFMGCVMLVALPLASSAHETRSIGDGKYEIVVGFIDEPVFAGDKSGLEFFVSDLSRATPVAGEEEPEGAPVDGLVETLEAEVIFEDQTMELPLEARWNTPGAYESVFFPMEAGDYTFRIYGKIGGTDIDESFTSSPQGFRPVEDPSPVQFPKK
jgi:hypothetical protein